MDISLKLNKNFVVAMNCLKEKYGEEFEKMNGFHNTNLNFNDFIDNFIDTKNITNVTIDSNANSSAKDINTLISDMTKPHLKLLAYNKIFFEITKKKGLEKAKEWLEEEWNGGFYLHNAYSSSYKPYCFAYDLDLLVEKGLFFINKFKSSPAKHLTTFNDHVLEFISWTSNKSSGAVGLPSYLVYSYYFWYNDVKNGFYLKDPEYYKKQCFQKFIYDLNQPFLRVTECAFTNITIMDRNYLVELFGGRLFPNGEPVIDHIEEIIEYQKSFMESVSEIRNELFMTFPVLTYSLLFQNGKFVDEEFAKWCSAHNLNWYDSNFYIGEDVTTLASCCRVLSDLSKVTGFINSIGGTALSVGSVQVNTINLRRIALITQNQNKYIEILKNKSKLCIEILDIIRGIIVRNIEKGLLPNYTYKLIEIKNQFNTIGISALYETIREFGLIETDIFGNKNYSDEGVKFAIKILDTINEVKDSYNFDYSINVEAIPGERANNILCHKDSFLFKKQTDKYNDYIYSNQWIPLVEKCTINEKIRLGSILDKKCGGGQISHINLEGEFVNKQQAWEFLNKIANSGVIYFAYNIKISVCENEHGFKGDVCPKCGNPKIDTFQRIVGYLVPTSSYSKIRKKEFDNREWFNINEIQYN